MEQQRAETKNKKGSRKLQPNQNGATSADGTLGDRARKRLGVVVTYLGMALLLCFALMVFFRY